MDKVNPNGHSKANLKLVRVNGVFTFYRRWGLAVNSSELLSLEEDIFQYAKKNLAVVNVYIKERDFFGAFVLVAAQNFSFTSKIILPKYPEQRIRRCTLSWNLPEKECNSESGFTNAL